jgi:prepilin-type N-terminal cleavage/methylation domain-containing protein/prepilin-type processing-associated H-X9-DG protein
MQNGESESGSNRAGYKGFTLIELLVVLAIIAMLIAILLSACARAIASARTISCANNVHRICQALLNYAAANDGRFPPNQTMPSPKFWYDPQRLGQYLGPAKGEVRGGVAICPEDGDAQRSYSMNLWASSAIDISFKKAGTGTQWKQTTHGNSRFLLVSERWSSSGNVKTGFVAPATVGSAGDTPGHRFGGGGGVVPLISAGRFGLVRSELTFSRHRENKGKGTEPVGLINVGYGDGHVELKSNDELVDSSGVSTLDTWWSPLDIDFAN